MIPTIEMCRRYKVWTATASVAESKQLLLRTGVPSTESDFREAVDVGAFTGTALEVAMLACERSKTFGLVWIKDFDDGRWYTAHVPGLEPSLLALSTIRDGKIKPP